MDAFPVKKPGDISALGFDFGTKRIGVASGQSVIGTAGALGPIAARDGIPDWQILDKLILNKFNMCSSFRDINAIDNR